MVFILCAVTGDVSYLTDDAFICAIVTFTVNHSQTDQPDNAHTVADTTSAALKRVHGKVVRRKLLSALDQS